MEIILPSPALSESMNQNIYISLQPLITALNWLKLVRLVDYKQSSYYQKGDASLARVFKKISLRTIAASAIYRVRFVTVYNKVV